jgi:hypothetical protein
MSSDTNTHLLKDTGSHGGRAAPFAVWSHADLNHELLKKPGIPGFLDLHTNSMLAIVPRHPAKTPKLWRRAQAASYAGLQSVVSPQS